MNIPENFVNRLKAWRERENLTQGRAAKHLKVTRTYLSQIENGREPGKVFIETFLKIERAQEISEQSLHPSVHYALQPHNEPPVVRESSEINTADLATATRLRVEARVLREMALRIDAEAELIEKRHGY